MAKLSKQDLKDGLMYERAMRRVNAQEVYTLKIVHVAHEGKVLCGYAGKLYKDTNLAVHKFPRCQRCENKLHKLVGAALKEEIRNVWAKSEAGVIHPVAQAAKAKQKKGKPVVLAEQMELPSELLPTGAGKGKGLF